MSEKPIEPLNMKDPLKNPSPFIFKFHPLHDVMASKDEKKDKKKMGKK